MFIILPNCLEGKGVYFGYTTDRTSEFGIRMLRFSHNGVSKHLNNSWVQINIGGNS